MSLQKQSATKPLSPKTEKSSKKDKTSSLPISKKPNKLPGRVSVVRLIFCKK